MLVGVLRTRSTPFSDLSTMRTACGEAGKEEHDSLSRVQGMIGSQAGWRRPKRERGGGVGEPGPKHAGRQTGGRSKGSPDPEVWPSLDTPGGTRTHNPLLRRQMPYPLGYGGSEIGGNMRSKAVSEQTAGTSGK